MLGKSPTLQSKADVKDGALVLYLPKAKNPCVWRMDLDALSDTAIAVDEKDGAFALMTRDVNENTKIIATFANRDDAEDALSMTLRALMSDGGGMPLGNFSWGKVINWGVAILVVLWLLLQFFSTPIEPQIIESNATPEAEQSSVIDESGQYKAGVPIDVDSLFENGE